jgi:hypothetical protein
MIIPRPTGAAAHLVLNADGRLYPFLKVRFKCSSEVRFKLGGLRFRKPQTYRSFVFHLQS